MQRLLRLALDRNPLERYAILRELGKGGMERSTWRDARTQEKRWP